MKLGLTSVLINKGVLISGCPLTEVPLYDRMVCYNVIVMYVLSIPTN